MRIATPLALKTTVHCYYIYSTPLWNCLQYPFQHFLMHPIEFWINVAYYKNTLKWTFPLTSSNNAWYAPLDIVCYAPVNSIISRRSEYLNFPKFSISPSLVAGGSDTHRMTPLCLQSFHSIFLSDTHRRISNVSNHFTPSFSLTHLEESPMSPIISLYLFSLFVSLSYMWTGGSPLCLQ